MKKKIIFVSLATVFMMGGVFIVKSLMTNAEQSELLRANIEALVSGEAGVQTYTCHDAIRTKKDNNTFFCGTCAFVANSEPSTYSSIKTCVK